MFEKEPLLALSGGFIMFPVKILPKLKCFRFILQLHRFVTYIV